ncbi:4-(cytidine 5'-diphospho)-2-C-methyl-D-erythritol kinase [Thiosocius teredinicola]|uniref:4-(cytidine 5'-diphospho)-2-C-methyl-D-erythritol kinase n=1 Tax=Thiosocius teredinicola TaxID=1973002 RepID=UPI000990C276
MSQTTTWPAPAKLNLLLRIVGRRADGYHLLQTVFQFIDLCDELTFSVREDGRVHRLSELAGVAAGNDLVVRAAHLLQQETGCRLGADIDVTKRIPMGGGLGGGSSDAATTLVALNHLWRLGLDHERLAELGLQLGADVPIFVRGRAAWAEGVGEAFTDIEPEMPVYLVLAPPVHVDTGKVFQDPELTRNSDRITIRDFLAGEHGNDCLAVVRKRYPAIAQVFDWLDEKASARMTGTGACLFAACADRSAAETLLAARPAGVEGFVVQGLNRSPLLDALHRARAD